MADPDNEVGSLEFANAVRLAAIGLTTAHVDLYNQATRTSKDLIAFLRSDEPLSKVDRDYLAELLAGEFRKRTGRKPRSKQENAQRDAVFKDYRALMEGMKHSIHGKPNARAAIDMLCTMHPPLTREQIASIVQHRTMRVSQTGLGSRKKTPG